MHVISSIVLQLIGEWEEHDMHTILYVLLYKNIIHDQVNFLPNSLPIHEFFNAVSQHSRQIGSRVSPPLIAKACEKSPTSRAWRKFDLLVGFGGKQMIIQVP